MSGVYEISYHPDVSRFDIPRLSHPSRIRIKKSIEKKLGSEPCRYGERLRKSLHGHWKLRVGDYRVIFRVENQTVRICVIGHRSEVYSIGLRAD